MGYEIYAEVEYESEDNVNGNFNTVDAHMVAGSMKSGWVKFWIKGDHAEKADRTKKLCNTLIDAGFVEFAVYHSY